MAVTLFFVPGVARSAGADSPEEFQAQETPSSPFDSAEAPPPPSAKPPASPAQQQAAEAQTASSGQWVHTQQYGWVWMPYGDAYSYVPPEGEGQPYEYVYYPSHGWTWVVAPWIWGFGPWPYFGVYLLFR